MTHLDLFSRWKTKKSPMNFLNLFKSKEKSPLLTSIVVVDEKRKWFKNGKHKLVQKLAFLDDEGNEIGKGVINRNFELKS